MSLTVRRSQESVQWAEGALRALVGFGRLHVWPYERFSGPALSHSRVGP